MQDIIEQGVQKGNLPFAVAMTGASDAQIWKGQAGDIAENAIFRIYSMTKAIGSLAAMALLERGQLDLDAPVSKYLPEFDKLQVLDGFDGDTPCLRPVKTQATIRYLMTHQSGLEYEHWNADIARYRKLTGQPRIGSGLRAGLSYPLTFDPGTSWGYGIGIDWLGQVIEAVDGRKVDVFCLEEILDPLGMQDTLFDLNDAQRARLAPMFARTANGFETNPLSPPENPEFYGMGQCLYSTASDYMRFLRMFLRGGELDGVRIVRPETIALMQQPQTDPLPKGLLKTAAPRGSADFDPFPDTPLTHTLGFMRVEEDVADMRSKGSLGWAGFANTHYWIDPARDVAAVLMTQTIPFGDPGFMETYRAFEKAVYAQ